MNGVEDGKMAFWCLLPDAAIGAKASTTAMDGTCTADFDAPMAKKMPAVVIVNGIMTSASGCSGW